ncbi:MAG TPA: extracellular solute-binding protein [Opitutaceae bacterium]|nr:extracellular solute-binding protein [Opitutaceae bacterium]
MKRFVVIFALVAIVAVPFALRPQRAALARADDTLVIITPHNEAIRYEFGRAFTAWYRARTGRTVAIDWRNIGGTSDIARFLEGEYVAAFQNRWTHQLGRPWSAEVQAAFQSGRLGADASATARAARTAFLESDVSCGIDLFFGGGSYDLDKQAQAGRIVASDVRKRHPEWFGDDTMPLSFGGEEYRDRDDRWIGTVLSVYGIIFNRDSLRRLGIEREPTQWEDLADPRLVGEVALADPTKSGSVAKAFENIIQQQMQRRLIALGRESGADAATVEARAVREGWRDGLRLLQRVGANARYFTDTSQKPPIDVAAGDCAAGLCIDFYGRQQQEAVRRRDHSERVGYVSPAGGSVAAVDPIALLRGAPHRAVAEAFIEFTMSLDGQKLWDFKPGAPGGPERFALRRMPVRRDFYAHDEWKAWRSDPEDSPFEQREPLTYRPQWTGDLFRDLAFVTRVMCLDTHAELARAWRAINAAPEPARSRALAALQDVSFVDYDRVRTEIHRALGSKNQVDEVRAATTLAEFFRRNYARAEELARGG